MIFNKPACILTISAPFQCCDRQGTTLLGAQSTAPGCDSSARGKLDNCVADNVNKRCSEPGCDKFPRDGITGKCAAHGGGKRCSEPGCNKAAQGSTDKCIAHGGGKRCSEPGCDKTAVDRTDRCVAHGGGKRCSEPGCVKAAQGSTDSSIQRQVQTSRRRQVLLGAGLQQASLLQRQVPTSQWREAYH